MPAPSLDVRAHTRAVAPGEVAMVIQNRGRRRPMRAVLVVAWSFIATSAVAANSQSLSLRLVAEDSPAGGTVQVKVYCTSPQQLVSGALTIDFDSSVFGDISSVA